MDETNDVRTVVAFLGVGANLGDRPSHVRYAVGAVERLPSTSVRATSSIYETEARIVEGQPDFLNACLKIETALAPRKLLDRLLATERERGRNRHRDVVEKGPRRLDLDLLLYGDRTVDEPGLEVPHPGLDERRFVLAPLAELDPTLSPPGLDRTVEELLEACPDDGEVTRLDEELRENP